MKDESTRREKDVRNYIKATPAPTLLRASSLLELLSEEDELDLVVDGQDTSTGDTTEDVGTSTLEEGLDTLSSHDLAGGVERGRVLDGL